MCRYAEAKVAKAESEHLRRSGDEARDRSVATDAERSSAQKEASELRSLVSKHEAELAKTSSQRSGLEAELAAVKAQSEVGKYLYKPFFQSSETVLPIE